MNKRIFTLYCCVFALVWSVRAADDLLIADFEGDTFGDWQATGDAFEKPVERSYSGQRPVAGFEGKRFVDSFWHGDRSQGTLTSPPFKIERKYISLKVGGGNYQGLTCVDLLVDGKVVRSETGKRNEIFRWRNWDVSDLQGKTAVIRIVDNSTAAWGHITVDHIVQGDVAKVLPPAERTRTIALNKKYLQFPINDNKPMVWTTISVNGRVVHKFQARLAFDQEPQWWAYLDVQEYAGEDAVIEIEEGDVGPWGVKAITQDDSLKGTEPLYDEKYRPQFHFSQKRGWNNDPNGMVYYKGEWHLYWQYGPFAIKWNNMYWGHAVSKDLVHWEELTPALRPYVQAKGQCYSGSAAVDYNNTGGFQTGEEPPIIAVFSDTGQGEAIAFSNDRGRTFTMYEGNPVIKHPGRDPKIFWYEPGKHWVIAVYSEIRQKDQTPVRTIAFYTSSDLKNWEKQSHIDGYFECPEIFELPVDGDKKQTRWVLFGADGKYAIGSFDGKAFTPDHDGKHQVHYGNFYASQCFNDDPKGRVVQIGWARVGDFRNMPFNQTFTLPIRLTLRTTEQGIRMFAEPVEEIKTLRQEPLDAQLTELAADSTETIPVNLDIFELELEFERVAAARLTIRFGQDTIEYQNGKLNGEPVSAPNGRVKLRLLVDRPMYELIGNDGECYITKGRRLVEPRVRDLVITSGPEPVKIHAFKIYPLKSIWKK